MDEALLLARVQFGLNIGFHILFPVSEGQPFAGAVAIFVLSFFGLAYSLFPYVVIDRLTIWEAAAHPSALVFILVGTLAVLPFLLGYTFWSYRIFRGKARVEDYGH